MKVALIGVGRWGKVLLGELSSLAEVKYQCGSKFDLNQVWNDPEIKAVFIATPTETHFEIASKALDAGKHVFLEKPGSTNSSDLEKLVNKAREKKLTFAIDYEFTHLPATKHLKDLINGKNIKSIRLEWHKWGTFKDNAVMHLLCHDVSVLKFFGFTNLSSIDHNHTKVISDTDIISTKFQNDQGIHIKSIVNRVSPNKQKTFTIILEEGGYIISNNDLFKINLETQSLDKIELPEGTPVRNSINDFLSSIQESREPQCNGQFALEVFKIIERVKS